MIDKDRVKEEADAFFEWPSKDKTYVTTTSMLIFTNVIAEMARAEEREACAKDCENNGNDLAGLHYAAVIRKRANVELRATNSAKENYE